MAFFAVCLPFGACSGALYFGIILGFRPSNLLKGAMVGSVFSLILCGTHHLAATWRTRVGRRESSLKIAGRMFWKWLAVGVLSFAAGELVTYPWLGLGFLPEPKRTLFLFLLVMVPAMLVMDFCILLELGESQKRFLEAQNHALVSQLSPHTLFNALNAIAGLIQLDPPAAERGVENLSRLLRRILQAMNQSQWSLDDEFQLLKHLLELEKMRFENRLSIQLVLPEPVSDRVVPPLILLPLVENSLKHGFRPKFGHCHLRVEAFASHVRITDNGLGCHSDPVEGSGLRIVRQQLEERGGRLKWPVVQEGCVVEVWWG